MLLSRFSYLLLLFVCSFGMMTLTGCDDDDDPEPENEEELITFLSLTLTPVGGGDAVSFIFEDEDGDGGMAPEVTVSGPLDANTTYEGELLLAGGDDGDEDITAEVREEDDEHQVFYLITGGSLTISYDDEDGDGNPLGLSTTATTGQAGGGQLQVILRHEPNKSAPGITIDNPTPAGGETDIEVTFNYSIQP